MKSLARFFACRQASLNTLIARRRLAQTMPGETGAMAALRLTGIAL
ncbi:MAG: hypothetical protein BroJett030_08520 [Alphaproteobacteria bacterium]|nr:MAG: hypothetical protein BroJett030_08520 [Alphaproteobacteria bacterium]